MNGWHAIVPLKQGAEAKSRLSSAMDSAGRTCLSTAMALHVLSVLANDDAIASVTLLSPARLPGWDGGWMVDPATGINAVLDNWLADNAVHNRLIVHADLPVLSDEDVQALIASADGAGAAMAPDRAGTGTNALALRAGHMVQCRFGPDSCRLHLAQRPDMALVRMPGLAFDVDTPADLEALPARFRRTFAGS